MSGGCFDTDLLQNGFKYFISRVKVSIATTTEQREMESGTMWLPR